ncbi:YwqJ-related putative deaminase, partial [Streptomyces sp. NPDC015184]|uniref:YwqJ-related putative deaminase n=1 Tax=Streptomyces sp. NPDC015184 TaxID=3364946 RepID=UPI0036FC93A3
AKGAGSGLSKIGDITKGLKGIENIEIPKLPDDAVTLPDGSTMLPDGTFHLPDGAKVPDGGIELPNGTVKFPDDAPVLPEGTTKLPTAADDPIQYVDRDGNLLDRNGDVVQHAKDAPKEGSPTTPHTDTNNPAPHTNSPVREPVLAGVGARNGDDITRLGSNPTDLGDLGRIGDDLPTGQIGDNLPGGHADDLGRTPSNSHEPPTGGHGGDGPGGHNNGNGPSGPHDPTPPHHNDPPPPRDGDHVPNGHADDGAHHGADESVPPRGSDDGAPHEDSTDPNSNSQHGSGTPSHHYGNGSHGNPQGTPTSPQPEWHGQSADMMRHHRRPSLDVSHLSPEDQLSVLERESAALADDALGATPGAALPGQNQLTSGCAGSLLHDSTITAHSSTTKMHGQKLPKAHKVLEGILKSVGEKLDATPGAKRGFGHGKCAEVSLISDRLHQLDPKGKSIRTVDDARKALEGSVMHTRQIGDLYDRATGELIQPHGSFLPPCRTCEHVLPQLGIRVQS